jgi:hypothetical protein
MRDAQMKGERGDSKVNRRVVLALASLPLLGLRKAEAMTEAEEIAKLQAEAARIQEIFDVQKAAQSSLPSLKDSIKAAKLAGPTDKDDSAGTFPFRRALARARRCEAGTRRAQIYGHRRLGDCRCLALNARLTFLVLLRSCCQGRPQGGQG